MSAGPLISHGTVARNRRAHFDYQIEDTVEAGIALTGSEVKSLRAGRANIAEAFAEEKDGELWLVNAHIPEWPGAGPYGHEPLRRRKLLLRRRQIARLAGAASRKGYTIVPISLYFNRRGIAKVQLGLGKGKRKVDRRATIKEREWKRRKQQLLKEEG